MSNTNDFLPFCATNTGTNLLSQSDYIADAQRPIGNQPGIARSQLANKALRQATYIMGQIAQYIANQANVSVLDDATPAKLLAQIAAAQQPLSPMLTNFLSGSGNWNATYYFFTGSANATVGATFTNNGITYTVVGTIAAGTLLQVTGSGDPTAGGGTLTKTSGSGDATITFYAFRKATYLRVRAVGGGGGGGGSGTGSSGGTGGTGGNTTFGAIITCNGGVGGVAAATGGAGGTASLGAGAVGIALQGGGGGVGGGAGQNGGSGIGGASPFGGAGGAVWDNVAAQNATTNSGSGGSGSGPNGSTTNGASGGAAGGYADAMILSPASTYAYTVGTAGTAGAAGTSGNAGGAGGSGMIQVVEFFQ